MFKNDDDVEPGTERYERYLKTHKLLRVFMSIQEHEGNDAAFRFYWELGSRIHHDQDLSFTAAEALESAGLDPKHAAAFDDDGSFSGSASSLGNSSCLPCFFRLFRPWTSFST